MDERYAFAISILIMFFILAARGIYKEYLKDEKVEVLYGYPAYHKTWLTVYHYRRTDRWVFEWDDLFDEGRTKVFSPFSQHFLYEDKKSGATQEEFQEAWRRCRDRGLL